MEIQFKKFSDGLVPVVVQDAKTLQVLMLGYMNQEAIEKTQELQKVTFFSRSKNRLWTKGESSGHYLELVNIKVDCDGDALLVRAIPLGPTCHLGTGNCWNEENTPSYGFLSKLEETIKERREGGDSSSYVHSLFQKGINKIAQKVGEEAIETVIEAKDNNTELFLNESADLLFHYLLLLQAKGHNLQDVVDVLESRHSPQN